MKEWNVQAAVRTLQERAAPHTPPYGHGRCAEYTRIAIEARFGGAPIPHTEHAKDYGPILMEEGFLSLGRLPGAFLAGDVAVIQALPPKSPHGHKCMFDGNEWISDFWQLQGTDGLYPGPRYRKLRPPYVIYRHPPPRPHRFESATRNPFARPSHPSS
ncbi:MAG TPA: hypothetical protein VFI53_08900 [Myxococcaceae bacterium]|nr:hypothetical protein [Myxococcaceae bacterium]